MTYLLYWPLIAIALTAILCGLIHNSKVRDNG